MNGHKALIGMSGGVDSSVAALLMQQAGFSCVGATMQLFDTAPDPENAHCSSSDSADARSVAQRLGIPHHTFYCKEAFARCVMDKFVRCYEEGLTPNPCTDCNRHLKFGVMLEKALEMGCDYVVTGHYARIRRDEVSGRYLLYKAADPAKDQTYFLYGLDQQQLAHTQFPLGELTKAQVRQIAEAHGFVNAKKQDSQDICFVPDGDYVAFMEKYTGKKYPAGDYLDLNGAVVGQHRGAVAYTIGQRKGLGLAMGTPVYVCGKDMACNTVTVGPNEALFSQGLLADDWNWFPFPCLTEPMEVTAKIRHSQFDKPATVYPGENGLHKVVFQTPQRAVSPGQAVVLYQGDLVIGGGTIRQALTEV